MTPEWTESDDARLRELMIDFGLDPEPKTHRILNKETGELIPATLLEWAKWFEDPANRIVQITMVGAARISTICLGLDHGYSPDHHLWFETIIFGSPLDEYQRRYETLHQALIGHKAAVEAVERAVVERRIFLTTLTAVGLAIVIFLACLSTYR